MRCSTSIEEQYFRSAMAMRQPHHPDITWYDINLIEPRLNIVRRHGEVAALRQRATMLLAQRGYLPDLPRGVA